MTTTIKDADGDLWELLPNGNWIWVNSKGFLTPLIATTAEWVTVHNNGNPIPVSDEHHEDDMVNSPSHYQTGSGLEAIDVIEAFFRHNYNLGQVFKYIARVDKKWDALEDLKKARWYLDKEIEWRENDD